MPNIIGTGPNQVPTNADLGTMAYQDAALYQNINQSQTGFKNRIINGAMMIDQRNAGASVTPATTSSFVYTLDRWSYYSASSASKFAIQQNAGSVTPPVGYVNYLGATSQSAYSPTSGEIFAITQAIEGLNIADLAWGTASASTVTVSFWVRSSLTGTFGASIVNENGTRSYPFSYSIPVANTWTQIKVSIAGDTTGTWLTTNGIGMYVTFSLGVGSTYTASSPNAWAATQYWGVSGQQQVVGTNGATFYITGVQLEKGSTATSFDYRPYGTELALCQRYYYRCTNYVTGLAINANITYGSGVVSFPVTMRAVPTLDSSGNSFEVNTGSAGSVGMYNSAGLRATQNSVSTNNTSNNWTLNAAVCVSAGFSAEL